MAGVASNSALVVPAILMTMKPAEKPAFLHPSVVIVDAQGKVAFNSSVMPESREAMMKEMEKLAKANDIPWPPNEGSEEEMKGTSTRLQIAMFSREIDRLLQE